MAEEPLMLRYSERELWDRSGQDVRDVLARLSRYREADQKSQARLDALFSELREGRDGYRAMGEGSGPLCAAAQGVAEWLDPIIDRASDQGESDG